MLSVYSMFQINPHQTAPSNQRRTLARCRQTLGYKRRHNFVARPLKTGSHTARTANVRQRNSLPDWFLAF